MMMRCAYITMAMAATTLALPKDREPIVERDEESINNVAEDELTQPLTLTKQSLCKKLLGLIPTKPVCCNGDVLGLAHHGCASPYPIPQNISVFVNGCLSEGKAAECCASSLLGVGLLCHNPTGSGILTRLLESVNGTHATILQISESEDATEPASVTELTQTLNETEEAALNSIFTDAFDKTEEDDDNVHEKHKGEDFAVAGEAASIAVSDMSGYDYNRDSADEYEEKPDYLLLPEDKEFMENALE